MEWLPEHDRELAELFEDWAAMLPAVERTATFEDAIAELQARAAAIELRLLALEASGNPILQDVLSKLKRES